MKKIFIRGLITSLSLVSLAACQDYDGGFNASDIKKAEYAKNFEETFGKVDPNQDWSMASNLQANVTVGNNPSVVIYSEKPGYAGSVVLGLVNGKSAAFNGIKGAEQIYAVVTENGHTLVSGYYDVVNGAVTINNQPVAKRSAQTRAGEPTVGNYLFTHTSYHPIEKIWDGETFRTSAGWHIINDVNTECFNYWKYRDGEYFLSVTGTVDGPYTKIISTFHSEWGNEWYTYSIDYDGDDLNELYDTETKVTNYCNGITKNADGSPIYEEGTYGSNGNRKVEGPVHWDAKYYAIKGDTKTTDVTWTIGDCKELFWTADPYPFFKEQEDYRSSSKMALYTGQGVSLEDVEAGVVYTTANNQEINIPMMFGATSNHNILGYYYYEDGQDFRTVNRYVLYEDARPNSNIKVDGTAVGNMDMQQKQGTWTDESIVTCTSRRLVYFGKNGNESGSFQFPADVHIGFFIMRSHNGDYSNVSRDEAGWAYSDPELNKQYFYQYQGGLVSKVPNNNWSYGGNGYVEDDENRGKVRALTWSYNGRVLVGFGDQANDYDLNDFVFWVDGEFKEEPKIKITTEDKETSWIFACEDLGGTFDYDFNDVVWEVAQKYEEVYQDGVLDHTDYGNIEIRLLAAGGTLPVNLIYNEENLGEVHQQLVGQSSSTSYSPVNVAAPKASVSPKVVKIINTDEQMDINTVKGLFKIMVSGADGQTYYAVDYTSAPDANEHESGNATPQMILLPATWEWPIENKCIKDAYPGFASWVNTSASDWVNKKTSNAWYVKKK